MDEIAEINTKIADLKGRIAFQEKIHDKVSADGNYYHIDHRDWVTPFLVGLAIGGTAFAVGLYLYKKKTE